MRRFAGLLGAVLLLSCNNATYGGGGGGGGCTPTATKGCMVGKSFSPTNLTISTGTAVSWDNGSTQDTAVPVEIVRYCGILGQRKHPHAHRNELIEFDRSFQ